MVRILQAFFFIYCCCKENTTVGSAAFAYQRTIRSSSVGQLWGEPPSPASSELSAEATSRKKRLKKTFRKRTGEAQWWRIFGVEVHPDELVTDENKSTKSHKSQSSTPVGEKYVCDALYRSLFRRLKVKKTEALGREEAIKSGIRRVQVVRQSLDARSNKNRADGGNGPRFVYVVDVELDSSLALKLRLKPQPGRSEPISHPPEGLHPLSGPAEAPAVESKKRVVIVGAGPAGLFCALQLLKRYPESIQPIVVERGQPVEVRGKDIGAFIHRRELNSESNFAFGEGGAGTWSDGKLTTRIGRNSEGVRSVLSTLVKYGAPERILIDGAPHLGTDNLVRILRSMRQDLRNLGGEIHFGAKMLDLIVENGIAKGVVCTKQDHSKTQKAKDDIDSLGNTPVSSTSVRVESDAVVMATGHSARDVYERLHQSGVILQPKGFAVGFRIEHPQCLINRIQYGQEWGCSVTTGKKNTDQINSDYFNETDPGLSRHKGRLPVSSYRLATNKAFDGERNRGAYSFCMCPGGQIVPASTDPDEVCVNGMSFSRRDSVWANSALVVTVDSNDTLLEPYQEYGVLAGIAFQRDMERRASRLGGGNLTVPAQRVTDFLARRESTSVAPSSYRLGVRPKACHTIYPTQVTTALSTALTEYFNKTMPGYVCDEAILHGVETRTSSPVRLSRDAQTLEAYGVKGLFPAGEGAGFAGGIVSAAVDGICVADAIVECLELTSVSDGRAKRMTSPSTFDY